MITLPPGRSKQALDTTTPAGRMLFQMLGVFAEFERSLIQARVNAGLARARALSICFPSCCNGGMNMPIVDPPSYGGYRFPSKKEMQALHLKPHDFHGEWNYTIAPKQRGRLD